MNPEQPLRDEEIEPIPDPVVEEIRAIRRKLWEKAGGDIEQYLRNSRETAARVRAAQRGEDEAQKRKTA